jgi:hypothetical protein
LPTLELPRLTELAEVIWALPPAREGEIDVSGGQSGQGYRW